MPLTQITTSNIDTTNSLFFRNRIINGDMRIDQRNAGASIGATNGGYTLDRWGTNSYASGSVTGKFTVQQNAGSVTPPPGFSNYLGVTSSAATSISANDIYTLYQWFEGYNIADLGFGTTNAKTVTISFWVRSSLTGTFGASLQDSSSSYCFPFTYTINTSNTWEQKTVTISGPTSGTFTTNNTASIVLRFGLGGGSNFSGTAGAWSVGSSYTVTGATSVVSTNGATWYVTGVQIEVGTAATAFERRPYGTEFQLCQRYYQTLTSVTGTSGGSTTTVYVNPLFPVTMRTAPTVGQTGVLNLTSPATSSNSQSSVGISAVGSVGPSNGYYQISNMSVSTNLVYMTNSNTNYITLSAEL